MAETANQGASHETGGGESSTVKEKGQQVRDRAEREAEEALSRARGQLRSEVDRRSVQAGRRVSQQASDLRSVSDQLRLQGKEGPASIGDRVADRVERVGNYLERSDADRILGDVEDFARRNPWGVLAGSIAAGFVASRLLKASSRRRYEERYAGRESSTRPARTMAQSPIDEPSTGRPAPVVDDDPLAEPPRTGRGRATTRGTLGDAPDRSPAGEAAPEVND